MRFARFAPGEPVADEFLHQGRNIFDLPHRGCWAHLDEVDDARQVDKVGDLVCYRLGSSSRARASGNRSSVIPFGDPGLPRVVLALIAGRAKCPRDEIGSDDEAQGCRALGD